MKLPVPHSLRFITAFSLVELLAVLAVASLLTAVSGPAIGALTGAGTVNKAIFDLTGTLQAARAYAMAHHTYVRISFAETTSVPGGMVVLSLCSTDGTLSAGSANPAASDMTDASRWPMITKPLVLENLGIFDSIDGTSPATLSDAVPSSSPVTFSRAVSGRSHTFKWTLQFAPSGEATVLRSLANLASPDRHIKIAMDRPSAPGSTSPVSAVPAASQKQFILRVSGVNGSVAILRKGEGI